MDDAVFETRMQWMQWGFLLHNLLVIPVVGSVAAALLVPMYAPLYPERYRSGAGLDDLTGTVILWYIAIAWALFGLQMLIWYRQRIRVFPDRVEIRNASLFGRRVRTIPLATVKEVRARRAPFAFGRYGTVIIKARRPRKTKLGGVRQHRELDRVIRDARTAAATTS